MNKPMEIASREWENIRHSLELCGDIGAFDLEGFLFDKPTFISNFSLFNTNLFDSSLVKTNFKVVLETFIEWQNDPQFKLMS